MTKNRVTEVLYDDVYLECTLAELIDFFQANVTKYGITHSYIRLDREHGFDERDTYNIKGDRLETDTEYKVRVNQQKAFEQTTEERERAQYEKLKKKYEREDRE